MDLLTKTISRYLFALPFAMFGLMQLMMPDGFVKMVPSFFPAAIFWVYITGLGFILAAVSIIIKKKEKLATLLLGITLLIFVLTIYLPGAMSGDQMAMAGVLKDTGLAGAAFFFSGLAKD